MSHSEFEHRQTAHCESGAMSALLRHNGLDLSEAMVFGLGAGLGFAYIPLIKLGGLPLITYRMPPGSIIKGVTKRLGIKLHMEKFRDQQTGTDVLTQNLMKGRPVGLQTSVFWLPYFPENMRFHFNAHNIVAYSQSDEGVMISDPTFEQPVQCDHDALRKARFVKGALAPKGRLYYPEHIPQKLNLAGAVKQALNANNRIMLTAPLPIIGIKGMRFVSRKIRKLAEKHEQAEKQNKLFIGHMVRMQEEIGTGGAGFRFLYASFIQEAAELLDNEQLMDVALELTHTGDEWRRFALFSAKMCKGREELNYDKLADQLSLCADLEQSNHQRIGQILKEL